MKCSRASPRVPGLGLMGLAFLATLHLAEAFSLPSRWYTPSDTVNRLQRRQDSAENNTVPAALSIGPSQYWDGIDGPWSSFPITVGSGAVEGEQQVRVMISTAATAVWTISAEGCPDFYGSDCEDSRGFLFNPNVSQSWTPNSIYQTGLEENLGMDSSGPTGYEVATLGWPGSVGATYEHAAVWNLADSTYWLGVFGLNPRPTNFTSFTDPNPSFLETIFEQNTIPSKAYGYTAGAQYKTAPIFGSLTLGGYDSNRFIPNDISFGFYSDISRDLTVYLQSVTSDGTTPSNLLPDGSISIFIDSTVPELWLPESACTAFEQAFGLEWDNNFNRYLLNDSHRDTLVDNAAEVTLTIGNEGSGGETVDITFPYAAFDKEVHYPIVVSPNTSYYFPLRKANDTTQYTLGRTFLQEAYIIVDYENGNFSVSQCNWADNVNNQAIRNIISPNATYTDSGGSEDSSISGGAIGGIVAGAVVVIIVMGLGIWFYRKRNSTKRAQRAELEAREAGGAGKNGDGGSTDGNESKPFISAPMGGELGGEERYELNVPQKTHAQEMDSPYRLDPNQAGYSEMEGADYYGPNAAAKYEYGGASEMSGRPVFEMAGSDVQEMPTPERRPSK